MQLKQLEKEINMLDMLVIIVVILVAYFFQFYSHELPCPLCLLQRVGFLAIAFGVMLNIHYGPRRLHYGLSILAALYTAIVSGRQVLLHIIPGDGGYGLAIFGLHLYTWGFIASIGLILLFILLLIFGGSKSRVYHYKVRPEHCKFLKWISLILFSGLFMLCVANAFTVFLECGFAQCPDNPIIYKY